MNLSIPPLSPADIARAAVSYRRRHGFDRIDPKAVLSDMDGVLYDTMPRHTAAWFRLATELGLQAQQDEFYAFEGMTGHDTINLLYRRAKGIEISREESAALYRRKAQYIAECGDPPKMPMAEEALRRFIDCGLQCVLVTGSGQPTTLQLISRDFPGIFADDHRVTALDVVHGKPAPEPYLKGLAKVGAQPFEAIVIENAPLGIQSAAAARCFVVAVATGPIPIEQLAEAGADIILPSMEALYVAVPDILASLK